MKTDVLIIGSGIAGLSFALKTARKHQSRQVLVITKDEVDETNTRYAQGGIASVTDHLNDTLHKHIEDTMIAGGGINDRNVVEGVVTEGPERIRELLDWGTDFDRDEQGRFHLGREGGHSEKRILHHRDKTGWAIEKTLLEQVSKEPNISIRTHLFATDLVLDRQGRCIGVCVQDLLKHTVFNIYASVTLLASGGSGQVYRTTTNPGIATGDGIAMAIRAGAATRDMEFVQFHPTALYDAQASPAFLISEAVRGEGAILRNESGEDFMQAYDNRGSLAPRDVVSRAIYLEMKKYDMPYVWLDVSAISDDVLTSHFPVIRSKCQDMGWNLPGDLIPVTPAAHYSCGGIVVNEHAQSSIPGLYACGECACTGLHGANRLASNSLLEALVFAHRAHEYINSVGFHSLPGNLPDQEEKHMILAGGFNHQIRKLRLMLQETMQINAGIVRTGEGLDSALEEIGKIELHLYSLGINAMRSAEGMVLCNMITVSKAIVQQARDQRKSVGLHYLIEDFPVTDEI